MTDKLVEKVADIICQHCAVWDECRGSANEPMYCNGHDVLTAKEIIPLIEKELKDKNSVALTENYFRGKHDGRITVEADIANARKEVAEEIKHKICCDGYLVSDSEHGHGYLIPDELWDKIFGTNSGQDTKGE